MACAGYDCRDLEIEDHQIFYLCPAVARVCYDVEQIKAAEAKNHSHLADFRKGLARIWRKMKWD